MATVDRAGMINLVAKRLGVLGQGQVLSSDDQNTVGAAVDSAHAFLMKRGFVNFPLTAVPEDTQTSFKDYVARDLVGEFGVRGERLQEILRGRELAERNLGIINEGPHVGDVEVDYM